MNNKIIIGFLIATFLIPTQLKAEEIIGGGESSEPIETGIEQKSVDTLGEEDKNWTSLDEGLGDTKEATEEEIAAAATTAEVSIATEGDTGEGLFPGVEVPSSNAVPTQPTRQGFQDMFSSNQFTGEANFRFPLFSFAGRKGINPALELSYSSFQDSLLSPYGKGFDLSVSSIFRTSRYGVDQIYERDDFAIRLGDNYNELLLENATAQTYRAKLGNDFSTYTKTAAGWVVVDNKGIVYTFGESSASIQKDPDNTAHVFRWLLTSAEDLNGNRIEYDYFQDHNQVYPQEIRYAFTDSTPLYRVRFEYVEKTASATSYKTQFELATYYLLQNVYAEEYSTGSWRTARTYTLTYDSTTSAISKLIRLQESGPGITLPALEFEYGTSGTAIHLLNKIRNNQGSVISLDYLSSTVYRDENGGANMIPFVVKTLHAITHSDATTGNLSHTTYDYYGGHYFVDYANIFTREYSGFREVVTTDALGNVSKTYFHQSELADDNEESSLQGEYQDHLSKKGKPYRQETYDDAGNLYQSTIRKWVHSPLPEEGRFLVVLENETGISWDGNAAHRDTAVSYTYDSYGNVVQEKMWGEVDADVWSGNFVDVGDDTRIQSYGYVYNTQKNILAAVKETILMRGDGTVVAKERAYYDELAWGSIAKGNLTKAEKWLNTTDSYISTSYTYTPKGLARTQTDPRGNTTTYQYDSFELYPQSVVNELGHTSAFTYDYIAGDIKRVVDPNGLVQEYVYDGVGRVTAKNISSNTDGPILVTKEQTVYSDTVIPRKVISSVYLSEENEPKQTVSYFDGFGQLIQTRTSSEEVGIFSVASIEYDPLGRVNKEFVPVFQSGSGYRASSQAAAQATVYEYDSIGRVTRATTAIGEMLKSYDVWSITTTDPNGHIKVHTSDAYGNLVEVLEYNADETYRTQYVYSTLGGLIHIEDAEGNVRGFTYDSFGRLLQNELAHKAGAGAAVYTSEYDSNGNKIMEIQPSGQVVVWTYDQLDRIVSEDDPATQEIEVEYTYDTATYGIGRVGSITSDGATITYGYDVHGNVINESRKVAVAKSQRSVSAHTAYLLNPASVNTGLILTSFADNNTIIFSSGGSFELDKFERVGVPKEYAVSGVEVVGTGPFSVYDGKNGSEAFIPIHLAGTTFVYPNPRYSADFYILAPLGAAQVTVDVVGDKTETISVPTGEVVKYSAGGYTSKSTIITSDLPILVFHKATNNGDAVNMRPATRELYGISSHSFIIGSVYDNTRVSIRSHTGEKITRIMQRGQRLTNPIKVGAKQGTGQAVWVSASKPVSVYQYGDGDGGEMTAFLSPEEFITESKLPRSAQYVAVVTKEPHTTVALIDDSGSIVDIQTSEKTFDKLYFGKSSNGSHIQNYPRIVANKPVFALYEDSNTHDERNVLGISESKVCGFEYVSLFNTDSGVAVQSLEDGNRVSTGDYYEELQQGEISYIPSTAIKQGQTIVTTQPISGYANDNSGNGRETIVSTEWRGKKFAIPYLRYTTVIDLYNPQDYAAAITIYYGESTQNIQLLPGEFKQIQGEYGKNILVLESSVDIVVGHETSGGGDSAPVPPASKELYGVYSTHYFVGATENNTTVTIETAAGSTTRTLNRGEQFSNVYGVRKTQGAGDIIRITADKPVNAFQFADGDGGESTAFVPGNLLKQSYGVPRAAQYVVAAAIKDDTTIELYNPSGRMVASWKKNALQRVLITTESWLEKGFQMRASKPILVIYEDRASNDERNVMGYSPKDICPTHEAFLLNSNSIKKPARIVSYEDNNRISYPVGSFSVFGKNQVKHLNGAQVAEFVSGIRVTGTKDFAVYDRENATEGYAPLSMKAKAFVAPNLRGIQEYFFYSPYADAGVRIENVGEATKNITVRKGEVRKFTSTNYTAKAAIITSTQNIVVVQKSVENYDIVNLPPLSTEVYGIYTNNFVVAAFRNNTKVTITRTNGETRNITLQRGEKALNEIGGRTLHGGGTALKITSNKPIAAYQYADGDGVEATAFLPKEKMVRSSVLPTNAQYIAIAAPYPNTTVELLTEDGSVIETQTSSTNIPGKLFFGASSSGIHIPEFTHIRASEPVYMIYEDALRNDERNLYGTLNSEDETATSEAVAVGEGGSGVNDEYTTHYIYDDYGALKRAVYANGEEAIYTYNILGQIERLEKDGQVIVESTDYNPAEKMSSMVYGNGVESTYEYSENEMYRLKRKRAIVGTEVLQDTSYVYDATGNIKSITDIGIATPKQAVFEYDGLDRLLSSFITAAGQTDVRTYQYSAIGNILQKSDIGDYEYTNLTFPHAVTRAGDITYEYDQNGNLIDVNGAQRYVYDYRNRMTEVSLPGSQTYTYKYDHTYNRVQKIFADGRTRTYLGELTEVNHDPTADAYTNYVFAAGLRVATSDDDGLHYTTADHLGSANVITDEAGEIEQKIDYFPFGSERVSESFGDFNTHFTYTNQEKDEESGLLYYGARYYDPVTARFTQVDPVASDPTREEFNRVLQNPQLGNLYSYVVNNPIKHTDPEGEILPALVVAWAVIELGLAIYDAYDTVTTLASDAPLSEKGIVLGGFALGLVAPGGGYGQAGKQGTKVVKNAIKAGKVAENAQTAAKGFKMSKRAWSTGKTKSSIDNIFQHFKKHGSEFGSKSVRNYYNKANDFIDSKLYNYSWKEGVDMVRYNSKTKVINITNKANEIKSFYKVTTQGKLDNINKIINKLNKK